MSVAINADIFSIYTVKIHLTYVTYGASRTRNVVIPILPDHEIKTLEVLQNT